jgi:hypothetical protein
LTLNLDLKRLRGRKLFVGTPMYDGKCHSEFAFSIVQLTDLCAQLGVKLRFHFACHDALITKARNSTVDEFLRSESDNLIFIDADIGFDARDVVRLLALQVLDERADEFDVIAAPYPLKQLSWHRVLLAAKAGLADENPDLLARYSSAVAISPAHGSEFAANSPVEVSHAGTGFMMIRRETFARYRDHHLRRNYTVDQPGKPESPSPETYAYFETEIDSKQANIVQEVKTFLSRFPDATPADILAFLDSDDAMDSYSGKYFSEDYAFCRRVREAGMKVWLCPWMELTHTGSHRFTSRLVDLGAIGAI